MKRLLKNRIYQFKVNNPYDGCWWEWCYAYVPERGKIHFLKHDTDHAWSDDLSSVTEKGYRGSYGYSFNCEAHCKRDLQEALRTGKSLYVYNLDRDRDIKEFVKECNEQEVTGCSQILNREYDIELTTKCPECNQTVGIADMHSTGYHGDGGIGVVLTGFVCNDCINIYTCEGCDQYDTTTTYNEKTCRALCDDCRPSIECKICIDDSEDLDDNGVCPDCQDHPEYLEFKTRLDKWKALQTTPALPSIDITPVTPEF